MTDPAGLKCGGKLELLVLSNVRAPPVMTYLVSLVKTLSDLRLSHVDPNADEEHAFVKTFPDEYQ